MFTSKHYINLLSSSIIGLISLIFVYKYSLIYFNNPLLLALVYALLFLFVVLSFDRIRIIPRENISNKYFVFTILIFLILLLYYIFFTNKDESAFGLLSIKNWLNNFFNGTFPYLLKNTFTAFPSFYLLSAPFYLMGNILLLEILIWGILALFIIYNSVSVREKIIKLFLLLVSPLTFYGIFEASLLFLNAVILMLLILLSGKYLKPNKVDKYFILFAIGFGLFFSLSIEVIAILIIYMHYFFRNHFRELSLFIEILLAVFLITIIPFIVWNPILFFINGPLNSFLSIPWWGTILYLGLAVYIGWLVSNLQEIFFAAGIFLIISSIFNLLFIHNDISGFIFALPFLIFSIRDYRVKKFSGKILINENQL